MRILSTALFLVLASHAQAETKLKVVTSIKPIHSLVSGVMGDVGNPSLLLEGASSPHNFNLKPSQANALQESNLVFWVGHSLEAFLEKPMETIGSNATSVELLETPNLVKLKFRESDGFEAHDHDEEKSKDTHDDHKDEDHHDHDKQAKDDHDDEHNHDEKHGKDEHDHDEHAHEGEFDPHVWLDPQNAILMVSEIRDILTKADAKNAKAYSKNAAELTIKLEKLDRDISASMNPVKNQPFVVFHDAYHYFENRYGLNATGSITINPENAPGAKRVKELQEKIKSLNVTCVFSEPQFNPKLVTLVTQTTSAKTAVLDPLGSGFDAGEELYFKMMNRLANSFQDCLG